MLWRALRDKFSFWRFLAFALGFRRRYYLRYDAMDPLRRSAQARAVQATLADATRAELEGLHGLAQLNARRQDSFLRAILFAYITIPLGVGAVWAQVEPGALTQSLQAYPSLWGGGFAGLTVAVLYRFMADWRARDLEGTLAMALIERDAAAPDA